MERERLDSWKQIAAYLGRSERTVRRWQQVEGLPVHRHVHQQRGSVWAYLDEVDAWILGRKEAPESSKPWKAWIAASGLILLGFAGLALTMRWSGAPPVPLAGVPLTSLPGLEYGATFSPDGKRMAFFWKPQQNSRPHGIYVKTLGQENVEPLVTCPAEQKDYIYSPAWSPDGKTIAYLRRIPRQSFKAFFGTSNETWLCVTPASGGQERRLMRTGVNYNFWGNNLHLSWTPDSQWIVAPVASGEQFGIYRIPVGSGEPRRMTRPRLHQAAPALSRDGRVLLFLQRESPSPAGIEEIHRQELSPNGEPVGDPVVLHRGRSMLSGFAWLPQTREVVLCSGEMTYFMPFNNRLYRMPAARAGRLVPIGPSGCTTVSTSPPDASGRGTLAYGVSLSPAATMWHADLHDLDGTQPLVPSTRFEGMPSYAPDGQSVAFLTNRDSAFPEIWLANADGTGARQLTTNSSVASVPRWSPDGNRLVYGAAVAPVSNRAAERRLYSVPIAGGRPVEVPASRQASDPWWSDDGTWIYYWSESELWRTRENGSATERVGEYQPHFARQAASHGPYVYYVRSEPVTLVRVETSTGKVEAVTDELLPPFFAMTKRFVYFVRAKDAMLCRLPLEGGSATNLGKLSHMDEIQVVPLGLSVSPDDRQVVWAMSGNQQSDLEMIRDFR